MMLADFDCDDDSAQPEYLRGLSDDQQLRLNHQLDGYLQALEQGQPIEREEFLDRNDDLREVLSFYLTKLHALYGIAAGLPMPPSQSGLAERDSESQPVQLGDFTILREIGRGGMGVVYEAQQHSLDRRVALKLLPMAGLLEDRQIARFKNEAHAAGLLHHPNIVPVHSVGSEQGIHFYAMQLIIGTPMDQWVQRRSVADPPPAEADDWQTLLIQFADVAEALHCAHQSGVVHRDVKPSNLLLDGSGKMWITDFGLARCRDDRSLTVSGDLIGTFRYMSPEQATGKTETVDHRTDIYSLAASLFESLTLSPAITGDESPTLLRKITQDDPPRLRDHRGDLPRDLSVVLQKAMAKSKEDRYESAGQFATDLRAIVAGEPTMAKPLSPVIWISRWMLKHRRSMTVAAMLVLLIALGGIVNGFVMREQMRRTELAEAKAEMHFHESHRTVDQLGSRAAQQLAAVPGAEQVRRSLLLQTLEYHRRFAAAAEGDAKLQSDLAITHSRIGALVKELDSSAAAMTHFRQAAEGFASISNPDDSTRSQQAQNLNGLALALTENQVYDKALPAYQTAIEIQTELVQRVPENLSFATELAVTHSNLGLLYRAMGDRQRAAETFQLAIDQLEELEAGGQQSELAGRTHAAALVNLSSLAVASDPPQAIDLLNRAIQQRLASIDSSSNRLCASSEIATMYNNLGSAQLAAGDFVDSEIAFGSASKLFRRLQEIAPEVQQHQRDLAMSLNNLAIARQRQAKHVEAVEAATEAIEKQSAVLPPVVEDCPGYRRLAVMHHNLATSLMKLRELDQAETDLRRAIEIQQMVLRHLPDSREDRTNLVSHYSSLLRCFTSRRHWTAIRETSSAYLAAAGQDLELGSKALADLAEVESIRRQQSSVNQFSSPQVVAK